MHPVLRPYQIQAVSELRAKVAAGKRRLVLCAPTGSGKTICAAEIVRSAVAKGSRVVVIAHRKELIDQTIAKLSDIGVRAGVVMADDSRADPSLPVQVCSTQTLVRRMGALPPADLVIYDEVHHARARSSAAILQAYPDAVILGLTATPWRSDRIGLSDVFEDHVLAETPSGLMETGALVRYEAFAYDSPALDEVKITAGEYNQRDLGIACNTSILVGNVVREYLTHARGRSAIVFPVNVAHSKAITAEFCAAGIAAEHVDWETPKAERARILDRFQAGSVTIVSSVGVLTEGFDCPRAEVAILARPTKSITLHVQMIGRVLRPFAGKSKALIHCHSGNLLRHGLPDDPRPYDLVSTPKTVRNRLTCPICCAFPVKPIAGKCPECGADIAPLCDLCAEYPCKCTVAAKEKKRKAKIEINGERISIDDIRKRRAAVGARNYSTANLLKIASATQDQKCAEYQRLRKLGAIRNFKPGFAKMAYRDVFGDWPKFSADELECTRPATTEFITWRRKR